MRGVWRGSKLLILSVAIIIIAVVFGFGAFAIATPALDGEDVVSFRMSGNWIPIKRN